MGSKGSNTTTQTYQANPAVSGAATQAIGMAQNAASQPFQMPVAPVAGLNNDQNQAFQQARNAQGMAQPYYNQASNYINSSAQPLTADQVNNYYNPMANSVMAQLANVQGQQMAQTTGNLTQSAGGVGADRIAVGQSELANQQGLAAGQTAAGLYQNALTAAQQNQQMQANAGYGLANLGNASQTSALQGTQFLNQTGNQQQAQTQNELNAPYQNQLAQLAYPFQTAQYLAGVSGGLGSTLGGTSQTTAPAPSIFSQILGGVTGAAGIVGGTGGFGTNGWANPSNWGSSSTPSYGQSYNIAGGGYSGMPVFAGGGSVNSSPDWMHADSTVPDGAVHGTSGRQNMKAPAPAANNSPNIGSAVSAAMKFAPMFLADGGDGVHIERLAV